MHSQILKTIAVGFLIFLPACSQAQSPEVQSSQTTKIQATKITYVFADQANALLAENKDLIVLDVRTPGEYQSGHIADAINIDFRGADFADNLKTLDPSKDYLIHCRSGGRSTKSLKTFEQLNFSSVIHLDGGIIAWNEAELPLILP